MTTFDELDRKLEQLEKVQELIAVEVAPKICQEMRSYAMTKLKFQVYEASNAADAKKGDDDEPKSKYVRTGNLFNSIRGAPSIISTPEGNTVLAGIECNVHYGKYIEFGTGYLGDPAVPHTAKKQWFYKGTDGEWHKGLPQYPRPFMRPALYDQRELFKQRTLDTIKRRLGI